MTPKSDFFLLLEISAKISSKPAQLTLGLNGLLFSPKNDLFDPSDPLDDLSGPKSDLCRPASQKWPQNDIFDLSGLPGPLKMTQNP